MLKRVLAAMARRSLHGAMNKEIQTALDACPALRFARAHTRSTLDEFRRSQEPDRARVMERAAFLSHYLRNIGAPLARAAQGPAFALEYVRLSDALAAISRTPPGLSDWNFPDDDGRQLLIDRLDDLAALLREHLARRRRRQATIGVSIAEEREWRIEA